MVTRSGTLLAIVALHAALAGCAETRDPAEPVRRAYEARRTGAGDEALARTFSRRLAALYEAGRARVDADPLFWARAPPPAFPADLAIDVVQRSWGRGRVRVRFTTAEPVQLDFEVRFERTRWVIDDIQRDGASFAAALAEPSSSPGRRP